MLPFINKQEEQTEKAAKEEEKHSEAEGEPYGWEKLPKDAHQQDIIKMKSKRFKHLNTKYKGTGLTKEEKKEWSELELERMDRDEFKSGFVLLEEKPET